MIELGAPYIESTDETRSTSGARVRKGVGVQVPPHAPFIVERGKYLVCPVN